jgi:hypothetical protein
LGTFNQSLWGPLFSSDSCCPAIPLREAQSPMYYTRNAKYKGRMSICVSALYQHRPPQLETSYPLLHRKASGSDWFDAVYHSDSQTHLDILLTASSETIWYWRATLHNVGRSKVVRRSCP